MVRGDALSRVLRFPALPWKHRLLERPIWCAIPRQSTNCRSLWACDLGLVLTGDYLLASEVKPPFVDLVTDGLCLASLSRFRLALKVNPSKVSS